MIDFTTFLAVDSHHLWELTKVWPSWVEHKPELLRQPMVVAYHQEVHPKELFFLKHPCLTLYPWKHQAPTRRAEMLASFVLMAPKVVDTDWILKLDTDVVATKSDPAWCSTDLIWQSPAFVASPWSYTKPANAIRRLDDWGDKVEQVAKWPRLDLPFNQEQNKIATKGRIISWCFFGQTNWCAWAASLLKDGPMPVYSHDTYLWYLAKRCHVPFKTVRMADFGWSHQRIR